MFAKMSLRDRLDCLVDFVGMILLCLLPLRLPSPNCFLRVFFPTLFAADLNDFLPLKPLQSLRQQTPTRQHLCVLPLGRHLRKKGIAVLPITCPSALNPRPRCRPTPL